MRLVTIHVRSGIKAPVSGAHSGAPGGSLYRESSGKVQCVHQCRYGFWETSHYDPGDEPPSVIHGLPLPVGIQICSDVNRPEGSHLLGSLAAAVIVCPRASEAATFQQWKTVLTANASRAAPT